MAYHCRNQLFRVLPRPVIVGAVGDNDRKAVSAVPRPREMIGGRLAYSVRGIRRIWTELVECALLAETAEHFVGRDLDEAESLPPAAAQPRPMAQRRLQEDIATAHISGHKSLG